jgi:hypothetical protein
MVGYGPLGTFRVVPAMSGPGRHNNMTRIRAAYTCGFIGLPLLCVTVRQLRLSEAVDRDKV